MNKKLTIIILIVAIFFLFPAYSFAQIGLNVGTGIPFGGWVAFSLPCICSFGLWVFMAPLYPNPPFPFAGALTYNPGLSTLYPYFLIGVPTTWHLGDYMPGVQTCWQGIPPFCVPIPAFGMMTRVGTSMAGFPPI